MSGPSCATCAHWRDMVKSRAPMVTYRGCGNKRSVIHLKETRADSSCLMWEKKKGTS